MSVRLNQLHTLWRFYTVAHVVVKLDVKEYSVPEQLRCLRVDCIPAMEKTIIVAYPCLKTSLSKRRDLLLWYTLRRPEAQVLSREVPRFYNWMSMMSQMASED